MLLADPRWKALPQGVKTIALIVSTAVANILDRGTWRRYNGGHTTAGCRGSWDA
jgi:hypothetical protein